MITQILLTQTFIMFILMILGLILSKTGLLTEHGSKDMANILLYAVIPCVIMGLYARFHDGEFDIDFLCRRYWLQLHLQWR